MASTTPKPGVLGNILATLHRLETQFEVQNDRLCTIEFFLSDSNSTPATSGSGVPSIDDSRADEKPLAHIFTQFDVNAKQALEEYLVPARIVSSGRVFNRFEFDSRSELAMPHLEHITQPSTGYEREQDCSSLYRGAGNDGYTASVYSSRPLSRCELDVRKSSNTPLPREWRGIEATCSCKLENDTEAERMRALRYEEMPITAAVSSSTNTSFRRSLSESQRSGSTAPTSTDSSSSTSRWSQRPLQGLSLASGALKRSLQRSVSLRSNNKGTFIVERSRPAVEVEEFPEEEQTPLDNKIPAESRFGEIMHKHAKLLVSIVPKFVSVVMQKMVEKQMKMLEVKV
ncbi:hypothetical protein BX600DRAFT_540354 [Xylariales sp. PMI_506]|nr:hypothetical protein BX600DRAFT_540354 [Xylariales sp. PMI_506]